MYKSIFLRVALVGAAELPRLGERRESAQVVGLVVAHQFALHLFRGTDDVSAPLEGAGTSLSLAEHLGFAVIRRAVTREQDCRLPLSGR